MYEELIRALEQLMEYDGSKEDVTYEALYEFTKTPLNINKEVWDELDNIEHIKMKF